MDKFLAAVARLLIQAGECAAVVSDEYEPSAVALLEAADKVAEMLPAALAARPDVDKAAILLLRAGSLMRGDSGLDTEWDAAEKQAMQLLGVVPLTPAAK